MNFDRIIDAVGKVMSESETMSRAAAKDLVCLVWNRMRWVDRREFLNRLNDDLEFDPSPTPIEIILWRWPYVMDRGELTGWDAEFAKDVDKHRRFRTWRPKDKQEQHIRRIYQKALFGPHAEVASQREAING